MSNRLGGKQGTAYLGTNANQPPNWSFHDRDPNEYDTRNVSIGDLWLNEIDKSAWMLVSLAGTPQSKGALATWVSLASDGTGALSALTGNSGGRIDGDADANINLVGDGIGIEIAGDPGTNTLTVGLVGGGQAVQSFVGDAGTAEPINGVINIIADTANVNSGSSVSFIGTGNTLTLDVTDADDNTIIGRSSGNLTITGGDNTILGESSGIGLTSGSDNTIIGGTSGNALTSGSSNIIMGSGAGSALTTSDSNNTLIGSAGFAGASEFVALKVGVNGATVLHNYPGVNASTTNGGNLFVGANTGNFTLAGAPGIASNNAVGTGVLIALTTGGMNNAIGSFSFNKLTTGFNNTALGHACGFDAVGNVGLISGSFNTLIGYNAGSGYTGAESSNIILGGATGTVGESNALRIGDGTGSGTEQLNKAFISGIRGITPTTNDGIPVFINSVGQLGTVGTGGSTFVSTVTGNSGGAVGPLAGNLNIVGDGTTIQITGNPGTNTLTVVGLGGGGGDLSILTGDTGSATAAGGTINVITNNASGSTVLFSGTGNTLTLSVSDADDNTIIGDTAGNGTMSGINNTILGVLGGTALTTGQNNAMVGYGSGNSLQSGSFNSFLGYLAGSGYTSETSNVAINAVGTAAESNTLRIGAGTGSGSAQINKAFISGIRGITPATTDGIPVFIGSAGQLGTVGNGGTTMVQTITGNSGGAVGPASGNLNIVGDGTTIQITGNPGTNTLTVVGLGGGGGDLSILTGDTGSATASGGTINVITGNSSQAAGSTVLFSGGSNTLILEVTDGNSNTIIGFESGNATMTGTNNTALGSSCAQALTTGSSNVLIGVQAGITLTSGSGNLIIGDGAAAPVLRGTTTSTGFYGFGTNGSVFMHNYGGAAAGNTFIGYGSAGNFNAGQQTANRNNTAVGRTTLPSLTTGNSNVALGFSAGSMTTGSFNTLLGVGTGFNYTGAESSNICIGSGTSGTVAESNALRIGSATGTGTGQINKTFIAGIRGITTGISNAIPVVIDSNGQLGTGGGSAVITSITGNSGGPVSAGAGNVNIIGDGISVNVSGNPGSNTLTISAVTGTTGPAFFATKTNTTLNVTGDGTPYGVIFNEELYDIGSNYNNGTGIFTAPFTGIYTFSCSVQFSSASLPTATQSGVEMYLFASSNAIRLFRGNYFSLVARTAPVLGNLILNGTTDYFMTAGDTAQVIVNVGNGAKDVQILGEAFTLKDVWFSGRLV